MAETRSKTGVILADTFRDNLIIDRYDAGFLTMRGAKTESMRSENSEDAITWNVFRSLAQIDPAMWLPWLFGQAFGVPLNPVPHTAAVRLWVRLSPPPTLRLFQKDEGDSEIDVLLETERFVWLIEAKYRADVSERTTNNPERDQVIRNIDVGSWYSGVRDFYLSLLILEPARSAKGVALIEKYRTDANAIAAALPHRADGLQNLKGLSVIQWATLRALLEACAGNVPRIDERAYAARAVEWLAVRGIAG